MISVVNNLILSWASCLSDSSRTIPPLLILSGCSSNCGLIKHIIEPVGFKAEKALGRIFVRDIKDKSNTDPKYSIIQYHNILFW